MTDMIDLAKVQLFNSPDVRLWPVTSAITHLALRDGTLTIDHTKRGQWPAVPYETTTQEATLWVFFQIGDQWCGTGGERLRPDQTEKALGKPSDIGPGWLYDINRWGAMTNYVPAVGELVGFMVVAGISRGDGEAPVQERSAVVLIPFPSDATGGSYPPFAAVLDAPGPVDSEPVIPHDRIEADHTDVVVAVKAQLDAQGVSLAGPDGAFAITSRVAWRLRMEGAGLLAKPGGNQSHGYATDIVMYPDGSLVDILGDGGGANTPRWDVTGEIRPTSQYRAAIDPGDPDPAPAMPPLDRIEGLFDISIENQERLAEAARLRFDAIDASLETLRQDFAVATNALRFALKDVVLKGVVNKKTGEVTLTPGKA